MWKLSCLCVWLRRVLGVNVAESVCLDIITYPLCAIKASLQCSDRIQRAVSHEREITRSSLVFCDLRSQDYKSMGLAIEFLEDWRGLIERDRKRGAGISREISESGEWRKMWREISTNQLSTATWIYQIFIPISDSRVFVILSKFR